MDVKELKSLSIDLMDAARQRNLSVFSLKTDAFEIHIETQVNAISSTSTSINVAAPAVISEATTAETVTSPSNGTPVEAPLVGIFYSAPAPDEPPFIEVGQQVKKGDTLFIIEAMKTMNEITAPCDGMVSRIMAQNGDMVEYKQVIVVIE